METEKVERTNGDAMREAFAEFLVDWKDKKPGLDVIEKLFDPALSKHDFEEHWATFMMVVAVFVAKQPGLMEVLAEGAAKIKVAQMFRALIKNRDQEVAHV